MMSKLQFSIKKSCQRYFTFSRGVSNKMKLQQQAVSPISARAAHFNGLNSIHKDFLFAEVVSINGAGLKYSAETDGVLIDLTPPEINTLRHTTRAPADSGYQVRKR